MPPKPPVRLKVAYKTPTSLLSEFTRSVGRGGVAIESRRSLPVGTKFVFELHNQATKGGKVEVLGEVVSVTPVAEKGRYLLNIRYDAPDNRAGLDAVLQQIFEAHRFEKMRKYPRVPLHLRATEDAPYSPAYIVRDVSRGGLGLELEAPAVPKSVKVGTPFLMELTLSIGTLALHGEVMWTFAPSQERSKWLNPTLGIAFGKLRPETVERLEHIISLRGLPPPPWKARISFGLEAVARMP